MTNKKHTPGENDVDFQINGETYFVNLAESGPGWEVLVATANGARAIPVYEDAPELADEPTIVVEDRRKRRMPN